MYWFLIHAKPHRAHSDRGGVYVCCWINFAHQPGAELLAKHYINEAGWTPGEVEEVRLVERDNYTGGSEIQYFNEAAEDGASFVFHQYPLDGIDEPQLK